jgi:hypothetical protein
MNQNTMMLFTRFGMGDAPAEPFVDTDMKIGAIAGITFKEAKRDRVLYLLFFFTVSPFSSRGSWRC